MKLSEILFSHTKESWQEAASKDFVLQMAKGTLGHERFKNYMLQDYLYLLDYIDTLRSFLMYTSDPGLQSFINRMIVETENETFRVHLPNMKKTGITEEDIRNCKKEAVISEYVGYMRGVLEENGLLAGLVALLQCSWVYAYIGKTVSDKYPGEIAASPFKDWFDAYTSRSYIEANQMWIDTIDRESTSISDDTVKIMCGIFETCSGFENRFWDVL